MDASATANSTAHATAMQVAVVDAPLGLPSRAVVDPDSDAASSNPTAEQVADAPSQDDGPLVAVLLLAIVPPLAAETVVPVVAAVSVALAMPVVLFVKVPA